MTRGEGRDEPSDLDRERDRGAEPIEPDFSVPGKEGDILKEEVSKGLGALQRRASGLFMSALSGGLDVGFSLLAIAVVLAAAEDLPSLVVRLLVANAYAVGFVFVVMGRSELFTEQTTLAVLPVLNGRATLRELARLWVLVYVGNLVGASLFAAIAVVALPSLGVVPAFVLAEIGREVTAPHPATILGSAVLAGWLMGLLSWLVTAGRDTISEIFFVWLVTAIIGFVGLHHSILGTIEVLSGVLAGGPTLTDFAKFLVMATVGNAIGGAVFVGLIKYSHSIRSARLQRIDLDPPTP